MQMPISNASPSAAPAAASSASGSTPPSSASVKVTEKGKFNQTFVQSLAGAQSTEANAQAGSDGAAAPVNNVSSNAIASLLGSNLSAADLLNAIEGLLQKLGNTDSDELSEKTTESDLKDALLQLDNLLSTLAGVPALPQPTIVPTLTASTAEGSSSADDDAANNGGALLAIVSNLNALAAQGTSVQAAETAVPNQSQAVVANLEELNALKAGLQEALVDLRSLLQDQKGTSANSEQLALISKQLTSIDQLISGNKAEAANVNSQPVDAAALDVIDSVRALQNTPQGNTHLQRMAHQLLHVSVLSAVQKPEENAGEAAASKVVTETADMNAQLSAANADIQRQLTTVNKPNFAQPVPVQQFASTIQSMVVKEFNVTTANGVSQAQLTLYPEHLGQVNVNISVHNGTLTAQFLTDTVAAKDMLENQMAQLRSALQAQGLQVDKLVVSQTSVQPNLFQDRQGTQGQQQGSAKRNKSNNDAIDDIEFATDLEDLSAQQAAARDLGLGRGIHTIA
ncbi:hypothetical protein GZH47_03910 [Paenibacillus rhizovicinus]|uniref:Flagellar hook-length control protein-like C-terminal domain-containing protein n=1 Tax=Paenibacillus rhizovicinus TaxID=2704463 RepID=A0A6C0NV55_9BACL|nr:flagellar hook-length control protein FliK [Paenibacillus rhizovicinus]QHW30065.1 hypothetical protein GZH47_03910 [Paenibacillus rhizovicinus]